MPSSRPDRRRHVRRAAVLLTAATAVLFGVTAASTTAGAQVDPSTPEPVQPAVPSTVPPLRPPTTLAPDAPTTLAPEAPTIQGSDCGPGNIVRPPYCGQEPESRDDPGGWLQVTLFFMVCAVVVGMVAFVWWRSRVARRERAEAGLDPVSVARRSGQGLRPGESPDT
jgi:hypothetical protein